ncbi:hypothetical protein [Anaerophaga thermohalophila]|uniref:hypothetical protein n=1 Tax=Anaerophaga thermohalophila TaxID=177400 RepID=UPI0011478411|nr:hypothetical protein [Anaerophaga thermohalophila]
MRFFTIRKILALLFVSTLLIQGNGQVPSEYVGAGSVKFIRFSIATPDNPFTVYELNLYYDGLPIWDVYEHYPFDDAFLNFKSDKIIENYSPENSFGFRYYYDDYVESIYYSGENQAKIAGNEIYYHNSELAGYEPTNSFPPTVSFSQINTPLLFLEETSDKRYFCESEFVEFDVLTKNTEFSGITYSYLDAPFFRASLQVALATAGDEGWITIKEDLIPGTISFSSLYIRDEWYGLELKFRIKQHMRTIPYQCISLGMTGFNNEASLESSLPDYYSEPITGFYFLENPDITIPSVTQPTCYDSNDATITIGNIPVSNEENQVRINLIKYFEEPSTLSDYGQVKNIGDTLFWVDQITDYFDVPKGQNSLAIDQNKISNENFKLTSGYYGIEAFYTDGSASGLCYKDTIIYIEEKEPLKLGLDVQNYSTSGGNEQFQIPVHGGSITIGGTINGNQGGYTVFYEDENGNSKPFAFDDTRLGAGKYTFFC